MKKVYLKTPEAVIKALKEGKEIRDENDYLYKIIDGFIVSEREGVKGNFLIGDWIRAGYHPYILEEEPFEIKVGKWYETRDHQKARCYKINDNGCCFTIDDCGSFVTNKKGCLGKEAQSLDIIGYWED